MRKKATDASMEILHDVLNFKDASRASYWCTPQDNDCELADAMGKSLATTLRMECDSATSRRE